MKFRKMASVLLAASLLIGCAAAENRTIFKKLSEEESMAHCDQRRSTCAITKKGSTQVLPVCAMQPSA